MSENEDDERDLNFSLSLSLSLYNLHNNIINMAQKIAIAGSRNFTFTLRKNVRGFHGLSDVIFEPTNQGLTGEEDDDEERRTKIDIKNSLSISVEVEPFDFDGRKIERIVL